MPANGRWDLICRLKVNSKSQLSTQCAVCVRLDANETCRGAIMGESTLKMHNLWFSTLVLVLSFICKPHLCWITLCGLGTFCFHDQVHIRMFRVFGCDAITLCIWPYFNVLWLNYLWILQPGLRCYHLYDLLMWFVWKPRDCVVHGMAITG